MCGLQFFGQVAVWGIRIHERIVRKRRAEAKTDDEAVQLRDHIKFALRVHDFSSTPRCSSGKAFSIPGQ